MDNMKGGNLLKTILYRFIKAGVLIFIILSSGFALYVHHKGEGFDPIREIQRLKNENRRDDALDMARFFRENQAGNIKKIEELENHLTYTFFEKVKSFTWNGVIKGEVYDSYSGMAAVLSDMCLVGDLRDLAIQSWKYLIDAPDFDKIVMGLSAAGIGFSVTAFVNGTNALVKGTVKYLKKIPGYHNEGILKELLSGKLSPQDSEKVWELLKKTNGQFSEPPPCLSNITHLKHIDTASDLIEHHKRTGNVLITLTGDRGLSLYALTPDSLKGKFIEVFKRKPKVILGLTKIHFVIHSIKVIKKYNLIALILPFVAASLIFNLLPVYLVWAIFTGSSGYLVFSLVRKSKSKNPNKKGDEKMLNQTVLTGNLGADPSIHLFSPEGMPIAIFNLASRCPLMPMIVRRRT